MLRSHSLVTAQLLRLLDNQAFAPFGWNFSAEVFGSSLMFRRTAARATLLTRRQHPRADDLLQQVYRVPTAGDPVAATLRAGAWGTFAATYAIIADWIYQAHLDKWDGTYGVDDEDEEDD